MLTSNSGTCVMFVYVITYGTSWPRDTFISGVVFVIDSRPCMIRVERDVVVVDLARTRHLAVVEQEVHVIAGPVGARTHRHRRRELRRLDFAVLRGGRDCVVTLAGQVGTENAAVVAPLVGGMICDGPAMKPIVGAVVSTT